MTAPVWNAEMDRAACPICRLVFLDAHGYATHLRDHRVRSQTGRDKLAPLEPDAFMAWAYRTSGQPKRPHSAPLTLDDWLISLCAQEPAFDGQQLRRDFVRLAASGA